MTVVAANSDQAKLPLLAGTAWGRWAAWGLSKLVTIFAVFSAAAWGWEHWIDLRFAGPVVRYALPVMWTVSVLLLNFLAQPRILVKGRSWQWTTGRAGGGVFAALLFPTYLIVACMLANLIYYVHLTRLDRIDSAFHLPMCVPILGMIACWLSMLYRWRSVRPHSPIALSRTQMVLAVLWIALCMLGAGWFFLLQDSATPPTAPVDLAVVFGHRVMPDGTASETLRARTLGAVDLYRRGLARHILVSGQIDEVEPGNVQSEALAMRQVCLDAGVPDRDIFVDPVGVNTRASVYNAKRLMDKNHWHSVVGVSSDYHLLRIGRTFQDAGIPAYTATARPAAWVAADTFDIVRETIALVVYSINPHYREAKAQEMDVQHPSIVVSKAKRQLELFDGDRLVKTYECFTGTNAGDKEREGDRKTPEGIFHVVYKNPESKFHLSLGLDYPNHEDARRGLETGLLTQAQYDELTSALAHGDMTSEATQNIVWKTPLGGEIFIHGGAEHRDTLKGSAGCVVVTNADIEELYAICDEGTTVRIEP